MSGFNLNDDGSFLDLLGTQVNNPNVGSSSNPNTLGLSDEEVYQQHQQMLYYEQQTSLNTQNFSNLNFTQHSQQSQTATNEVSETPTSPPKKTKFGRIKRKSRKSKNPEPEDDADEDPVANKCKRWNPQEEKVLAQCYVAASEDGHVGKNQSRDTFWQRVQREFNRVNYQQRNKDMLQSKWRTLNRDCSKFNAYYKRSKRQERSGESELDILKRAREMYRDEHKTAPFSNEEAWEVLRSHVKWDTPEPVDLTGEEPPSQTNEQLFGHDEIPRPMGRRASKKARSESTGGTSTGASTGGSSSMQFVENMTQEYRHKREMAIAAYRATKEKEEAITRLEEIKFLKEKTAGEPPEVVWWINQEKARIVAKYNLGDYVPE